MLFSVTSYLELNYVVLYFLLGMYFFYQVKSFVLYIVHTTYLMLVGNKWNLQWQIIALDNSKNCEWH